MAKKTSLINKIGKEIKKRSKKQVSISSTIIENAMRRSNWLWSDKYYEKFLSVVNKAKTININDTAQAFQDMINDGVLVGIQKDYKPEDFWVDFSTFSEYFEDIVPEEAKELEQGDEDEEDRDTVALRNMTTNESEAFDELFPD